MAPAKRSFLGEGSASWAACGAWVWTSWRRYLGELGWQVSVLDLRGHGRSMPVDLSAVTLEDYVTDLASVTKQIEAAQGVHPVLAGWGMGGMVAMMYAVKHPETPALFLLEPSPPLEVGGRANLDTVRRFAGDVLDLEHLGIYPDDPQRSHESLFDLDETELADFLSHSDGAAESGIAFRQNLRGISIPRSEIDCPVLVLHGETEGRVGVTVQNRQLAQHLRGESLAVPGAGHWGIVWHDECVAEMAPGVDAWLRSSLGLQE